MPAFHAIILTIFPEMFPGTLEFSLAGRALKRKIWSYEIINIRDFGITKHKKVDDTAYGGGAGLIMRPDVLGDAIDYSLSKTSNAPIYYPSPRGEKLSHKLVKQIISNPEIIILCGRFEGIDERTIEEYNIKEISIGDYILSGGELAALVILDCSVRLLPNVLVNACTLSSESFEIEGEWKGGLECPLYTRPVIWKGRKVPEVLLSGNHTKLRKWQQGQSLQITKIRRPDLLQ